MANLSLFFTINLVISSFMAVMFPVQVGLQDPLGIEEIREQNFADSIIASGGLAAYYTEGTFFDADGNVVNLDAQIKDSAQLPAEGDQSVVTDAGFGFLDYVRVVFNFISSVIVFLTIPIVIMFTMGQPLNMIYSLVYGALFLFSVVSYIVGR